MKYAVEVGSAAKFHEDWFRHSKVVKWGFTDTQAHIHTDSMKVA
jgi:hypothetical protein